MGSDGEGAAAAPKATAAAKRAPASKAAKADAPARGRGRGRGAAAGRGRGRGAAAKGGSAGSSGGVINLSDDDDDDGFGAGADTVSPHHLLPRRGPTHPCHPDVPSPRARLQEQAPPARSKRSSTARAATKRSRRGYQASPPFSPAPPTLPSRRNVLRFAPAPAGAKTPTTTPVTRTMPGTCSHLVLRRAARPSRSRASAV